MKMLNLSLYWRDTVREYVPYVALAWRTEELLLPTNSAAVVHFHIACRTRSFLLLHFLFSSFFFPSSGKDVFVILSRTLTLWNSVGSTSISSVPVLLLMAWRMFSTVGKKTPRGYTKMRADVDSYRVWFGTDF